jgi:hypothetical protein
MEELPMLTWLAMAWLACFASTLVLVARAPIMDEDQDNLLKSLKQAPGLEVFTFADGAVVAFRADDRSILVVRQPTEAKELTATRRDHFKKISLNPGLAIGSVYRRRSTN